MLLALRQRCEIGFRRLSSRPGVGGCTAVLGGAGRFHRVIAALLFLIYFTIIRLINYCITLPTPSATTAVSTATSFTRTPTIL